MSNTFEVKINNRFDLTVKENQSFTPLFIFTDNDGNTIDLSGAIAKLIVGEDTTGACIECDFISFQSIATITGVNNNRLQFSDTIDIQAGSYSYDLILEYPNGETTYLLIGKFNVRADASSGGGSAELPYKVYSFLIKQAGTGTPTVIVLQNTLGTNIIWARSISGEYRGTPQDARTFTQNKAVMIPFGTYYGSGTTALPIFDFATVIGYYVGYCSITDFVINVTDPTGLLTDLSSLIGDDGDLFFEVRVYE